jgi:hypothetical protein
MNVDLQGKEERGSFDLKGGGKVHLRLRNEQDEKEIRAACVTTVVEYPWLPDVDESGKPLTTGKYVRFESEKTDTDLFLLMCWDRNITGWEGVLEDKKPVSVTPENKVLLMRKSADFRDAVTSGLQALQDALKLKAEQAEKN